MNFDEARACVVAATHTVAGVLHVPRSAAELASPQGDITFSALNIDSLAAMELCIQIEDRTGVEVDLGDLIVHPSVNALAAMLVSRSEGG
jgi:acyl carrier protein